MNLKQSFKMSMQSILSNKVRSMLTMLGIIIGVGAVIIMVSVVQGQNAEMKRQFEAMGTNRISVNANLYNGQDLTQDLYEYCQSLDDLVLGVTPNSNVWGNSTVKYKTINCMNNEKQGNPQIYLGSDQYAICNNFTINKGRDLSYLDCKNTNAVVILGDRLSEFLFQAQDPIGKEISIGGNNFTVVGTYAAKDPKSEWSQDYMCVVPYTMGRLLNQSGAGFSQFTVKAAGKAQTTEAITRITGFLSGRISPQSGDYWVSTDDTWQEDAQKQSNMMSLVLGGIAGISLLVGGIGIMNIMLVTVTERTREIGIRKAIGGSRRSIITQFLIEASVLCGMGGVLGVVLGYLGTLVAGKLILKTVLFPSVTITVGAVTFSVILGILFGLYPAIKASGLQPVDALRAD